MLSALVFGLFLSLKPLKIILTVLLCGASPHPKTYFIISVLGCFLFLTIPSLLNLENEVAAKSSIGNYYKCIVFSNFDGMTCEIFFNTFLSFKPTLYTLMNVTPFMLLYPLSKFFKLKPRHFQGSKTTLCFVLGFLIWFNFFFDPYNSEFELFFAMQLMLFGVFADTSFTAILFIVIYFAVSFVKMFNIVNYTNLSFHESTSNNLFNYISYSCVSIMFLLTFIRLKRRKKVRKLKKERNQQ